MGPSPPDVELVASPSIELTAHEGASTPLSVELFAEAVLSGSGPVVISSTKLEVGIAVIVGPGNVVDVSVS